MYRYGMTQWIVGNEDLESGFRRLQKCGYDTIEFAGEPDKLKPAECLALMKAYHLDADSICGIFSGPERDLTSGGADALMAVGYLKKCVDFGAAIGSSVIIVVPSPVGRTRMPDNCAYDQLWDNAVRNIRDAAEYAQTKNIRFAVEAINRYETYFVNTLEKAYRLVREIDHKQVGIMADTFHMNLEENNIEQSLRMIADKLIHVHIADNTREPAGMGTIDFNTVVRTLRDIRYQGILCMEFLPRVADPYQLFMNSSQSLLMDRYADSALRYMKSAEGLVSRETPPRAPENQESR